MVRRKSGLLVYIICLTVLLSHANWCAAQPVKVLGVPGFVPAYRVVQIAAGPEYDKGWLHKFLFGKHYRKVWAEPVNAQIFDITRSMGGFIPLKMGGSFQTKNLRLEDSLGKEFVIRSVNKDPAQKLSKRIQKSFIARLVRDQTSVIHPYGYYIVPTLSDAVGVYHTNPRLIYIPDDPDLGEFRQEFANMLAMLEERPDGERQEVESFGSPVKVYSSRKAYAKIFADPCHRVDARHYLRSRLFDIWIGDWSRREDQWRWAIFEKGNVTAYRGVPRDRDHAFFLLDDGVISWVFTRFKPDLQSFHHKIKNVNGYSLTGRPTDLTFFNFLTKADFLQIADSMQQALTDEVINEALAVWPENIRSISEKEFTSKLTARRQQLPKVAEKLYAILATEVNIPGTDKKEKFNIERLQNGDVKVQVYSDNENCTADSVLGERIFHRKETRLIRIYGLGGDDKIQINGSGKRGIKLEIYGGEGKDEISNLATSRSPKRYTKIYDSDDGDEIKEGKKAKVIDDYNPLAEEFNSAGWLLRHRLY